MIVRLSARDTNVCESGRTVARADAASYVVIACPAFRVAK